MLINFYDKYGNEIKNPVCMQTEDAIEINCCYELKIHIRANYVFEFKNLLIYYKDANEIYCWWCKQPVLKKEEILLFNNLIKIAGIPAVYKYLQFNYKQYFEQQ